MAQRDTFRATATAVADLVGRIPVQAYGQPALGTWDVRALVGHTVRALTTVTTYLAADAPAAVTVADGGTYFALAAREAAADPGLSIQIRDRGIEAGHALGDDPAAAFRVALSATASALATAADDRVVAVRGGSMLLDTYLTTRTFELVVHALDLAAATGEPVDLPIEGVRTAVAIAADTAALVGRGPQVLFALTGRAPLPPGFTLVP